MTFNIVTLGCKVNQYESQLMFEYMCDAGFTPVEDSVADITIINSCTVTHVSDSKNRKVINRTRRENDDAIIVLTGCMPQAYPEKSRELIEADIVLSGILHLQEHNFCLAGFPNNAILTAGENVAGAIGNIDILSAVVLPKFQAQIRSGNAVECATANNCHGDNTDHQSNAKDQGHSADPKQERRSDGSRALLCHF